MQMCARKHGCHGAARQYFDGEVKVKPERKKKRKKKTLSQAPSSMNSFKKSLKKTKHWQIVESLPALKNDFKEGLELVVLCSA